MFSHWPLVHFGWVVLGFFGGALCGAFLLAICAMSHNSDLEWENQELRDMIWTLQHPLNKEFLP